ncbi:MAG TPA: ABC transporter permease [Solirubrobacteraceae bacterium]|jgi:ABC-type polysaccharide/polyol phosphate export permease|nr:ABC transporter permease [Solirubrobacteraceae bacterium]
MLEYRYLFGQLVRRELRQRYKGSALGILWYLVNPLLLMGVYGLLFGVLLKARGTSTHDYLLFLFVGLIVWLFFSQSLLAGASSLLEQSALVARVRFPRETVPASVVTVQLVTFCALLALALLVAVALRGTGVGLVLLVPLVVCLYAFALGLALVVSILHAYFRDVQPILAAVLLPWFFLSPIFFQPSQVSGIAHRHWLEILLNWGNPVAPFIRALRSVVFDGTVPSAGVLAYVVIAAALALAIGLTLFRRLEDELAVVL